MNISSCCNCFGLFGPRRQPNPGPSTPTPPSSSPTWVTRTIQPSTLPYGARRYVSRTPGPGRPSAPASRPALVNKNNISIQVGPPVSKNNIVSPDPIPVPAPPAPLDPFDERDEGVIRRLIQEFSDLRAFRVATGQILLGAEISREDRLEGSNQYSMLEARERSLGSYIVDLINRIERSTDTSPEVLRRVEEMKIEFARMSAPEGLTMSLPPAPDRTPAIPPASEPPVVIAPPASLPKPASVASSESVRELFSDELRIRGYLIQLSNRGCEALDALLAGTTLRPGIFEPPFEAFHPNSLKLSILEARRVFERVGWLPTGESRYWDCPVAVIEGFESLSELARCAISLENKLMRLSQFSHSLHQGMRLPETVLQLSSVEVLDPLHGIVKLMGELVLTRSRHFQSRLGEERYSAFVQGVAEDIELMRRSIVQYGIDVPHATELYGLISLMLMDGVRERLGRNTLDPTGASVSPASVSLSVRPVSGSGGTSARVSLMMMPNVADLFKPSSSGAAAAASSEAPEEPEPKRVVAPRAVKERPHAEDRVTSTDFGKGPQLRTMVGYSSKTGEPGEVLSIHHSAFSTDHVSDPEGLASFTVKQMTDALNSWLAAATDYKTPTPSETQHRSDLVRDLRTILNDKGRDWAELREQLKKAVFILHNDRGADVLPRRVRFIEALCEGGRRVSDDPYSKGWQCGAELQPKAVEAINGILYGVSSSDKVGLLVWTKVQLRQFFEGVASQIFATHDDGHSESHSRFRRFRSHCRAELPELGIFPGDTARLMTSGHLADGCVRTTFCAHMPLVAVESWFQSAVTESLQIVYNPVYADGEVPDKERARELQELLGCGAHDWAEMIGYDICDMDHEAISFPVEMVREMLCRMGFVCRVEGACETRFISDPPVEVAASASASASAKPEEARASVEVGVGGDVFGAGRQVLTMVGFRPSSTEVLTFHESAFGDATVPDPESFSHFTEPMMRTCLERWVSTAITSESTATERRHVEDLRRDLSLIFTKSDSGWNELRAQLRSAVYVLALERGPDLQWKRFQFIESLCEGGARERGDAFSGGGQGGSELQTRAMEAIDEVRYGVGAVSESLQEWIRVYVRKYLEGVTRKTFVPFSGDRFATRQFRAFKAHVKAELPELKLFPGDTGKLSPRQFGTGMVRDLFRHDMSVHAGIPLIRDAITESLQRVYHPDFVTDYMPDRARMTQLRSVLGLSYRSDESHRAIGYDPSRPDGYKSIRFTDELTLELLCRLGFVAVAPSDSPPMHRESRSAREILRGSETLISRITLSRLKPEEMVETRFNRGANGLILTRDDEFRREINKGIQTAVALAADDAGLSDSNFIKLAFLASKTLGGLSGHLNVDKGEYEKMTYRQMWDRLSHEAEKLGISLEEYRESSEKKDLIHKIRNFSGLVQNYTAIIGIKGRDLAEEAKAAVGATASSFATSKSPSKSILKNELAIKASEEYARRVNFGGEKSANFFGGLRLVEIPSDLIFGSKEAGNELNREMKKLVEKDATILRKDFEGYRLLALKQFRSRVSSASKKEEV